MVADSVTLRFVLLVADSARKAGTADQGHMVLFETQFRSNQIDGDDKGLSAPHVGLYQFAICDGSVRAISDQIDEAVYNAIATWSAFARRSSSPLRRRPLLTRRLPSDGFTVFRRVAQLQKPQLRRFFGILISELGFWI